MDLAFTPDERKFQHDVRQFMRENLPEFSQSPPPKPLRPGS